MQGKNQEWPVCNALPAWHAWHTLMQAWWVWQAPPNPNDAAEAEQEPALASLIEPRNQPCCPGAVGTVLVAKLRA
jgi:hypothetical protein